MPSKDPEVLRRAQARYRKSHSGRVKRAAYKKLYVQSPSGIVSKAKSDKKWRTTAAYKAIAAEKARKRKKVRRDWLFDLKSKLACSRCGYKEHPAALQFHHTDDESKVAGVTFLTRSTTASFETIMDEIAKCVVLCANCHAIHHYEEHQAKQ